MEDKQSSQRESFSIIICVNLYITKCFRIHWTLEEWNRPLSYCELSAREIILSKNKDVGGGMFPCEGDFDSTILWVVFFPLWFWRSKKEIPSMDFVWISKFNFTSALGMPYLALINCLFDLFTFLTLWAFFAGIYL